MERTLAAEQHYKQFIDEAFIRPIRSVLIVDDDYPTIDSVLERQIQRLAGGPANMTRRWERQPERIKAMMDRLRAHSPALLIDVHDGAEHDTSVTAVRSERLHQSDLLVLDYQLEGSGIGSGEEALRILGQLLENRHFNMVIVYSQEDAENVFTKVLLRILNPSDNHLSDSDRERAKTLMTEAGDVHETFIPQVRRSMDVQQYLYFRRDSTGYEKTLMRRLPPYADFAASVSRAGWSPPDQKLVARLLFEEYEREHLGEREAIPGARGMSWGDGRLQWIKAETLFVTFVQKTDDDDLLSRLRDALHDWSPDPSRLFGAKTRAEMESVGITAQDEVVEDRPAFAYWYDGLVRTNDEDERHWRVEESVARHAERLMDVILPAVECFGRRLLAEERQHGDLDDLCARRFAEDMAREDVRRAALVAHNTFVCSKKATGWHLRTGHIFVMSGEHWLCVSPACDLVPSQSSRWQSDAFGKNVPFIAVRLRDSKVSTALNKVNTNRFVFIRSDGTVRTFCFNDIAGVDSAPEWHLLYAEDRGRLVDRARFVVGQTICQGEELRHTRQDASIVGQLRYEYALNLVQKLGGSLTRIGLDFIGVKSE